VEREEKRRQLVKLLAEIERRINQENARPQASATSARLRGKRFMLFTTTGCAARLKTRAPQNFPTAKPVRKKLYGELTMIVTVNFDGRVLENVEVVEDLRQPRRWTAAP
jgi:protein TonB